MSVQPLLPPVDEYVHITWAKTRHRSCAEIKRNLSVICSYVGVRWLPGGLEPPWVCMVGSCCKKVRRQRQCRDRIRGTAFRQGWPT